MSGTVPSDLTITGTPGTLAAGTYYGKVTVTPSDTSALRIGVSPDSVKTSGSTATFKIKVKGKAATGPQQIIFTATDASNRVRTGSLTVVVE